MFGRSLFVGSSRLERGWRRLSRPSILCATNTHQHSLFWHYHQSNKRSLQNTSQTKQPRESEQGRTRNIRPQPPPAPCRARYAQRSLLCLLGGGFLRCCCGGGGCLRERSRGGGEEEKGVVWSCDGRRRRVRATIEQSATLHLIHPPRAPAWTLRAPTRLSSSSNR